MAVSQPKKSRAGTWPFSFQAFNFKAFSSGVLFTFSLIGFLHILHLFWEPTFLSFKITVTCVGFTISSTLNNILSLVEEKYDV